MTAARQCVSPRSAAGLTPWLAAIEGAVRQSITHLERLAVDTHGHGFRDGDCQTAEPGPFRDSTVCATGICICRGGSKCPLPSPALSNMMFPSSLSEMGGMTCCASPPRSMRGGARRPTYWNDSVVPRVALGLAVTLRLPPGPMQRNRPVSPAPQNPVRQAKHLHCHARNTSLPGVDAPSKETDNMLVYTTLDEADSGVPPCDEPP